jgi:hypothetical protein
MHELLIGIILKTDRKIERKCKDRKRNCGCETHGKGY